MLAVVALVVAAALGGWAQHFAPDTPVRHRRVLHRRQTLGRPLLPHLLERLHRQRHVRRKAAIIPVPVQSSPTVACTTTIRVRSAVQRHQSPERPILRQISRALCIPRSSEDGSSSKLCAATPRRLYILCWREHSRRKLSPTLATPNTLVLTTLIAQCELSRR